MTQNGNTGFTAPEGEERIAGLVRFKRPPTAYDLFMEEEGIPIYRGIGVKQVRDLPLRPWARMGGRGTYIQLDGTEGQWSMYLVEVPPGGALNPERHIYEEVFLVVDGRGSTEVWQDGQPRRNAFEWQAGAMFSVPINAWHRLVNATNSPALVLAGTGAPPLINIFRNREFIFNNPFAFTDRYSGQDDYYKATEEVVPHPVTGRAVRRSNVFPDIVNCEMPLDNQRSPGYRRFQPFMAGNVFFGGDGQTPFIGQHAIGRYSKAHAHGSGAVLICVRGRGYTFNWPMPLGIHPWQDGHGDQVRRQDYEPIGMVSAAPGGGDWFHQHFGAANEPLRLLVWSGNFTGAFGGRPGEEMIHGNANLEEGGKSIDYPREDPFIRKTFEEELAKYGLKSLMPEDTYTKGSPVHA